jgi:hypothetical protein
MKIKPEAGKAIPVGKGFVHIIRKNPKEFVLNAGGAKDYLDVIKKAYAEEAHAGELEFKNSLYLERGPYDIVSVMDESVDAKPYVVKGPVIDLFDPELPVLAEKTVNPGEQAFLYQVSRVTDQSQPKVLASASRISAEQKTLNSYSFICKSPLSTINSMRVLLPAEAKAIILSDAKRKQIQTIKTSWDASSRTSYLSFDNSPDGIQVKLNW